MLGSMLLLLFVGYVKQKSSSQPFWYLFLVFLWFAYFVYRFIKRNTEHEILKGYIKGLVTLSPKFIEYENVRHKVNTIEKVQLVRHWKEGDIDNGVILFGTFNGKIRWGVENSITIYFKDGNTRTLNFQLPKVYDEEALKLILIEYTKAGLMSFIALVSTLGIDYKEAHEIKGKHFSATSE